MKLNLNNTRKRASGIKTRLNWGSGCISDCAVRDESCDKCHCKSKYKKPTKGE